jgi:hypothetical protein
MGGRPLPPLPNPLPQPLREAGQAGTVGPGLPVFKREIYQSKGRPK